MNEAECKDCRSSHHVLKCWPEYFKAIGEGRKTFEVREDDRNFQEGDSLELREWNPETKDYTQRWIWCRVSYVLRGGNFGVSPRHVVMGIKLPANHEWPIAAVGHQPKAVPNDRAIAGSLQQAGYAAKSPLEIEAESEAAIAADVFNPNETDLEYFLRRKAALEQRQHNRQLT